MCDGTNPPRCLFQFVGKPEQDLVLAMGVPVRTYEAGGLKFLAFESRSLDILPSPAPYPFFPYGPVGYGYGGLPPTVIERVCDTTAEISGGVVRRFTFQGNACG